VGRQSAGNDPEGDGRDMLIDTGAWTNMSIEHTARTGADKGYFMIVPEDCCSNHERRVAQRIDQFRECRTSPSSPTRTR